MTTKIRGERKQNVRSLDFTVFIIKMWYNLCESCRKDGRKMNDTKQYVLRPAVAADAEEIHRIMEQVYEQLENKEYFVCDDLDYVREQLVSRGVGVVACEEEGRIIGSLILHFPGMDEDNLGRDIGLPEKELEKVVHMESAVVLPFCRGCGLQKKMLLHAEEMLDSRRYAYLMATVDPQNRASYQSLLSLGYEPMIVKEKYGGLTRAIMMKRK